MNFVFVYITNPTKEGANKIAKHFLKKRLIACANIFPTGKKEIKGCDKNN